MTHARTSGEGRPVVSDAEGVARAAIRSDLFRAWWAQAWRCVLLTAQAMAGGDLTDPLSGWVPAQAPVVPDSSPRADEPRAVRTEGTPHAVPERPRGFTPAEVARLRVLRTRYHASRAPFTTREVAHLHFVRWLHQRGHIQP
jgi:hypothetical protein